MYSSFDINSPVKHGAIRRSAYFWITLFWFVIRFWRISGDKVIFICVARSSLFLIIFIKSNLLSELLKFILSVSSALFVFDRVARFSVNPIWNKARSISKVSNIVEFTLLLSFEAFELSNDEISSLVALPAVVLKLYESWLFSNAVTLIETGHPVNNKIESIIDVYDIILNTFFFI